MTVDHFYTTSTEERKIAIKNGYIDEGIACYVLSPDVNYRPDIFDAFGKAGQAKGAKQVNQHPVALYRLYNPHNWDHFYTIWSWEKDEVKNSFGYQYEGIMCFIFSPNIPLDAKRNIENLFAMPEKSLVPLFRLFSNNCSDHLYTIREHERRNMVQNNSYRDEGVQGYVMRDDIGDQFRGKFMLTELFRLYIKS